jgi:transitional endoplasmic reticulum ATPase
LALAPISSVPEILSAEARGFAKVAKDYETDRRLQDARTSYLKASDKFAEAALASSFDQKEFKLDLAKFFLSKAMELKETIERQERVEHVDKPATGDVKKMVIVEKPDVTFDQIGGLNDVKETLKMEVIYPFQKHGSELYGMFGREPGAGVLLYGPPGCGKTLLAKAVARESDATFIAPKISDIMNMYVGESEKRINEIFEYARTCERSVIFLDEMDSIFPRQGPSYAQRIKNELLQQMDGMYSKKKNLLLLGGTNKSWRLDTALIRPGRLGKMIFIPPPDLEARKTIFKIHLKNVSSKGMLAEDIDFEQLSLKTNGFSGADIEQVCKEAVDVPLYEALKGANPRKVTMNDFIMILEKKQPSIITWFKEAIESTIMSGDQEIFADLIKYSQDYLAEHATKAS